MGEITDTICILRKIERQIDLPEYLYELITAKAENVVVIIPKDLRKILLFPTTANEGLYCKIFLKRKSKLDDSFFIELREKLTKYNLKTLYTTGVCFSQEECYWEGIFEYHDDFDLDVFKKEIYDIKTVTTVKMDVLKPLENINIKIK
jgi:hypothetical protein